MLVGFGLEPVTPIAVSTNVDNVGPSSRDFTVITYALAVTSYAIALVLLLALVAVLSRADG